MPSDHAPVLNGRTPNVIIAATLRAGGEAVTCVAVAVAGAMVRLAAIANWIVSFFVSVFSVFLRRLR